MDFSQVLEHFELLVLLGCLVAGYILKHTFDFVPNKYIPAILAALGAALNASVAGVTLEAIIYGATMGLASTGMHQAFKRFIENTPEE